MKYAQEIAELEAKLLADLQALQQELAGGIFEETYSAFKQKELPYIIGSGHSYSYSELSSMISAVVAKRQPTLECPITRRPFSEKDIRINQALVEIAHILESYLRGLKYKSGTLDFSQLSYDAVSKKFIGPTPPADGVVLNARNVVDEIKKQLVNAQGDYFNDPRVDAYGKTFECPEGASKNPDYYPNRVLRPDATVVQMVQALDALCVKLDGLKLLAAEEQSQQEQRELELISSVHGSLPASSLPAVTEDTIEPQPATFASTTRNACRGALATKFKNPTLFLQLFDSVAPSAEWETLRDDNGNTIFKTVMDVYSKYPYETDTTGEDYFIRVGLWDFIALLPSKMPMATRRTLCQEKFKQPGRSNSDAVAKNSIETRITALIKRGDMQFLPWVSYNFTLAQQVYYAILTQSQRVSGLNTMLYGLDDLYRTAQNSKSTLINPKIKDSGYEITFAPFDPTHCSFRVIAQDKMPADIINQNGAKMKQPFDTPAIVLSAKGNLEKIIIRDKSGWLREIAVNSVDLLESDTAYTETESLKLEWDNPLVQRILNTGDKPLSSLKERDVDFVETYWEYQRGKKRLNPGEAEAQPIVARYIMKQVRKQFTDEQLVTAFAQKDIYPFGLAMYLLQDSNGINARVELKEDGMPHSNSAAIVPWIIPFFTSIPADIKLQDLPLSTLLKVLPADGMFSRLSLSEKVQDERFYYYRGLLVTTGGLADFKQAVFQRFGATELATAAAELHTGSTDAERVNAVLYLSEQLTSSINTILALLEGKSSATDVLLPVKNKVRNELDSLDKVMKIVLGNCLLLTRDQVSSLRAALDHVKRLELGSNDPIVKGKLSIPQLHTSIHAAIAQNEKNEAFLGSISAVDKVWSSKNRMDSLVYAMGEFLENDKKGNEEAFSALLDKLVKEFIPYLDEIQIRFDDQRGNVLCEMMDMIIKRYPSWSRATAYVVGVKSRINDNMKMQKTIGASTPPSGISSVPVVVALISRLGTLSDGIDVSLYSLGMKFDKKTGSQLLHKIQQIIETYEPDAKNKQSSSSDDSEKLVEAAEKVHAKIVKNMTNALFKTFSVSILDEISKTNKDWSKIGLVLKKIGQFIEKLVEQKINFTSDQIDLLNSCFAAIRPEIETSNNTAVQTLFAKLDNLVDRHTCTAWFVEATDTLLGLIAKYHLTNTEQVVGALHTISNVLHVRELSAEELDKLKPIVTHIMSRTEELKTQLLGDTPNILTVCGLQPVPTQQQMALAVLGNKSKSLAEMVSHFNLGCQELMRTRESVRTQGTNASAHLPHKNNRITSLISKNATEAEPAVLEKQEKALLVCYSKISTLLDGVAQAAAILVVLKESGEFFASQRGQTAFKQNLLSKSKALKKVINGSEAELLRLQPGSVAQVVSPLRDTQGSSSSPFSGQTSRSSGKDEMSVGVTDSLSDDGPRKKTGQMSLTGGSK